jgi:hypothetical protein
MCRVNAPPYGCNIRVAQHSLIEESPRVQRIKYLRMSDLQCSTYSLKLYKWVD